MGRKVTIMQLGIGHQRGTKAFKAGLAERIAGWIVKTVFMPLLPPRSRRQQFARAGNHRQDEHHPKTEEAGETERLPEGQPRNLWEVSLHHVPKEADSKCAEGEQD